MDTVFALSEQLMVDDLVSTTKSVAAGIKISDELIKLGETCNLKFCKFD